jgi:hypothetical protein
MVPDDAIHHRRNAAAPHRSGSGLLILGNHMDRFRSLFNSPLWSIAIPLAAFVAGCQGSGANGNGAPTDTTPPTATFRDLILRVPT